MVKPSYPAPVVVKAKLPVLGGSVIFLTMIVPRSRVTEFPTVNVNVPVVEPITIDAGVNVAVAHVNPVIGVNVASLTEHVFPVGIPDTVAEPPAATDFDPVSAVVPSVSSPQL